jgi:YD repeat-containing protein
VIEDRRIEWNEERFIQTRKVYDGANRLIEEFVGRFDPEIPRALETHQYRYDERGSLAAIEAPDPRSDSAATVVYRYERPSV